MSETLSRSEAGSLAAAEFRQVRRQEVTGELGMRHVIPGIAVVLVLCLILSQCDSSPVPVVKAHYASGALQIEAEVDSQGRNHGMVRKYYEDGTLSSEAEFSHGSMSWVRHYWPNGQLQEEQSNGIWSTSRAKWSEDGKPLTP